MILTGLGALNATLAAGIPLKLFYAKSPDNAPESYSADLPPWVGECYKAYISGGVSLC